LGEQAARTIFDLIRDDLALVEAEFERQAGSNIQVHQLSRKLFARDQGETRSAGSVDIISAGCRRL
jgi:hypothetical protein